MLSFSEFKDHIEWAKAFLNKPVRLLVGEREHNGKKYPEVKAFKPSEAPAPEAAPVNISDDDVREPVYSETPWPIRYDP